MARTAAGRARTPMVGGRGMMGTKMSPSLRSLVAITSRRATVHAVVLASEDLRRGLVSLSHSYGIDVERLRAGGDPGEPQPFSMGNHTGALASAELDREEPYTGLPRMSAIPVRVASAG